MAPPVAVLSVSLAMLATGGALFIALLIHLDAARIEHFSAADRYRYASIPTPPTDTVQDITVRVAIMRQELAMMREQIHQGLSTGVEYVVGSKYARSLQSSTAHSSSNSRDVGAIHRRYANGRRARKDARNVGRQRQALVSG